MQNSEGRTWDDLFAVDPIRAAKIHPNDTYRISRALSIWHSSGVKPSAYVRQFRAISCRQHIVWLGRDRAQFYERINERTEAMIKQGWIDECKVLAGTEWEAFIRHKKMIGYTELFDYLKGHIELE